MRARGAAGGGRPRGNGRRPLLYMLTSHGAKLLVEELGCEPEDIDWRPEYNNVAWPFLRHQLAINDAYVAFKLAAERIGWRLEHWVDDRILKQNADRVALSRQDGSSRQVAVVPDAYMVLTHGPTDLCLFVEIDRATMSVAPASHRTKSWRRRIQAYQAYFTSEAIVTRYTTRRIRVLTATTGNKRLANLKQATEEVGGRLRYWFALAGELTPDTALTAPVWQVASKEGLFPLLSQP